MKTSKGILQSEKDGITYVFFFDYKLIYHSSVKSNIYFFDIWEDGKELDPMFHPILKIVSDRELKSIDLYPPDYYKGKGISIAFILKSKILINNRIISSSNDASADMHEKRRDDATEKVWKPLVKKGLAGYDSKGDFYFTL